MNTLHLNLKTEYFEQIKQGTKLFEYRDFQKWEKRLNGKVFDRILIKKGYPKNGDAERIIERPFKGFEIKTITHPHFGIEPIKVFAIVVN